ncbi:lipid A export permease/ATP-binding protein MsbA [Thiomicrorhabdus sediminis]|uniref:Lipid A export permease/ATP-binding protein MsbA n=1 Tax=Thiomicrorhabdus sediminis TaxID=2580412 RepID=A0A4P9K8Q6_9GAMM|nr:lipid A export permease/ATP-binding protein MsbA [Thiomicrorhabdus sediminis]QCU90707.1 lipid A export permease/ATP-binding protein MsbA [Thiomicrorhabdus sediminis]
MNESPKVYSIKELYPRLFHYVKPYWKAIILLLLALILTAAMEPLMPALLKPLIDDSMIKKDMDAIVMVPLLLALVFIGKGIGEYFSKVVGQWIAHKAILDIRYQMFKKLNALPLETFQRYSSGRLMSKLTYDVLQLGNTLSEAWIVVIRDSLIILGLLGFLLYTSWQLTLMILLIAPVVAWIIQWASKLMRNSSSDMQNSMGELTHSLEESISAHKDIKIYGAESYEENKHLNITENLRQHTMEVIKVSALNVPLVQVIAAVAMSSVIYAVSLMSAEDLFTPGELIAFIVAAAMIFEPIRRLTNINETIQKGMAAAESIFELLDQPEEQDAGKQSMNIASGGIVFDKVGFKYSSSEHNLLTDLSFNLNAGTTTALVGESGSGKTTIANLISRFYNIQSGSILLDGIDIKDIKLKDLREQIAFVSQDVVLFNDSIRANIAYGHNGFDEQAIIAAAKSAHAWEFIEKLPDGLDTQIGDNGSKLSGGQRQRIAIARAFLKNAPILILDEATSALDNQSEAQVQQALEELRKNRTVLIIAHRLSTVESADNIIVLDKGRLVEQGSHQQLMQLDNEYARLQKKGMLNA